VGIDGYPESQMLELVLNAEVLTGIKKDRLRKMGKLYKSVKEMVSDMTGNIKFMEEMFDIIDKKFDPIQILIHKEGSVYVATFNNCGGGTQARSINKLLDNIKEVLYLVRQVDKDRKRKETKLLLKKVKNAYKRTQK
jgi:uncharacterized spore protein YtfJ